MPLKEDLAVMRQFQLALVLLVCALGQFNALGQTQNLKVGMT
jgi:hypothetical protein